MSAEEPAESGGLESLFERITGETTVRERQRTGISHRVLDRNR